MLPYFTNLPTDVIVNRFHFESTGLLDDQVADLIQDRLAAFYRGPYPATQSSRVNYIDWQRAEIRIYDLAQPTPRVPLVRSLQYGNAGTTGTTVPTEVACVLSWHAAPVPGVRFQRLYNRIYLGGLLPSAMVLSATDEFPRIASGFVTQIIDAAQGLLDENDGVLEWIQVSNATGSPVLRPIAGGWVDNSPDTQRRRSVLPTLRNNWSPL